MTTLARMRSCSPFGPIFSKELRITSRRKRSYILRVAYLGLLLLALLVGYAGEGRNYGGLAQQAEHQEQLGEMFFMAFSIFCVCAMGLIAPILTATSIGSEKLAKTLPVLMMTPINAWQIASGKLFSRLLAALTLLGLSLPVLALVRLLGGVEIHQMVAVIVLCATFALSSAAIGLFYSALMNRAYAVILLAYATQMILYMFIPFIAGLVFVRGAGAGFMQIMLATNPVAAVVAQSEPSMSMRGFQMPWEVCAGLQTALATGLLAMCAVILRRLSSRDSSTPVLMTPFVYMAAPPPALAGNAQAVPEALMPTTVDEPGSSPVVPPPLPPPITDYQQAGLVTYPGRRPGSNREVYDNPILWREIRRPLLARPWMRWTAGSVILILMAIVYLALASSPMGLSDPEIQIGFAIIFAGLYWLLVAVISATAIASEKESDTWTLLLATPVSGATVVWSKFAGIARRMLWPTVFILCHFIVFAIFGVISPWVVLLVLWVILTFNSVWVAIGLYLSLRLKKVTFAVIANLILAVGFYAVVPAVLAVVDGLMEFRNDLPEVSLWTLPYWYLGSGINGLNRLLHYGRYADFRNYNNYYGAENNTVFELPAHGGRTTVSVFFGILFAVGCLHLLITLLLLLRTSSTFDAIVGRAGKRLHVGVFETDEAIVIPGRSVEAPIWRRSVALAIDNFILRGGCLVLALLAGAVTLLSSDSPDRAGHYLLPFALGGLAASVPLGWLYYAGFESSRRRATPGKSLAGICVTDGDGRRVSFGTATLRYVASLGSALAAGAGYLMAIFATDNRAFHDRTSGTHVLRQ